MQASLVEPGPASIKVTEHRDDAGGGPAPPSVALPTGAWPRSAVAICLFVPSLVPRLTTARAVSIILSRRVSTWRKVSTGTPDESRTKGPGQMLVPLIHPRWLR